MRDEDIEPGIINNDVKSLVEELKPLRADGVKLFTTSGGFDPLHVGHLRCITETARQAREAGGIFVVIVNGDGFLTRKKGRPFMHLDERMEMVAGIRGVDYVTSWDDGTQTVCGALRILSPNVFTKGGDEYYSNNVPENQVCSELGCEVRTGTGGNRKVQSSSKLVDAAMGAGWE